MPLTWTDAASLAADARRAFYDTEVVDTAAPDDERVAAIGSRRYGPCLLLVRHADQSVERISFRSIWLRPGELESSVELYATPPR